MIRRDRQWKYDIRTAKELLYPDKVIEALKEEKDHSKRAIILCNARLKMAE